MRRLSIGVLLATLAGVLLALAVAIAFLNGALGLRIVEERAEQSARQLAQTAAFSLQSYLEDAEASLAYLGSRGIDPDEPRAECRERLAHVGSVMSHFFQVGQFDADGDLICASTPIPEELAPTLVNEPWFEPFRRGDTVVVGPPTHIEEIDVWVSPLAFSVVDDDGSFRGAIVGTIDLDRFQRLLDAVQLPEDGLLTVSGVEDPVVVARSRRADEWVGRRILDEGLSPEELRRPGVNRVQGMDGVMRIWGYAPVPRADWVVFSGFPLRWIQGPAWRAILGTAALAVVLMGLAIYLVVRVHGIIAGSVRELVLASRSAARGEVDRISVEGPPEIQELAAAFNRTLNDRAILDRRLREAEKTEALARLSAGVAHDFRNLLTVITGEASLALAEIEGDHPVKENLHTIEVTAKRTADVTRKLLAFSQQDPEDATAMDLNAHVREEARLLALALDEGHSIRTEFARDVPPVLCGERRINVILRELVENAVDALPGGGVVEIRTGTPEPGPQEDAESASGSDAGRSAAAYLEVRDRGEGMPPRVRDRIFEPFFSTRIRGRGTGLGMPTVQGLMKQLGGWVSVESEPGHGTRVRVYFPAPDSRQATGDGPPQKRM